MGWIRTTAIPNAFSLTPNILTASDTGSSVLVQSYAIGHTYIVSSNLVQSFHVGFERSATNNIQDQYFDFCQAGVQNFWCGAQPNQLGGVIITGGFTGGGGAGGGQGKSATYITSESANEDVNWIKGSHQIAFGAGFLVGKYDVLNDFAGAGQFTFNGSVTGLGMADFLTGNVSSFLDGLPNIGASAQNFMNLYVTDSWRVNARLTFNFGLRWEPYLPMVVKNGTLSNFSMSRFLAPLPAGGGDLLDRSTVFRERARTGSTSPAIPAFRETPGPITSGTISIRAGVWPGIPKGTERRLSAPAMRTVMRPYRAYRGWIKPASTLGADAARIPEISTSPIRTRRFQAETRCPTPSTRT